MQRQLAAILYADIVGYSRLMGQNERETHAQLSRGLDLLTAEIEASGGNKMHEAGDAILAEFASVTAAVDTALRFQRQMAEQFFSKEISVKRSGFVVFKQQKAQQKHQD